MLEEGEHPPAQGTHQGRRLDGLQFGEGCCCQEVLAPVGTPLGSAFAEATNPPRAHTSSREIMKVFSMTISMVAGRHQRRGDLSVISGPSVSLRRAPPCCGSGYPRVCLLFLTGWGMRGCVHDGEDGHKWREAASEEVA